MSRGRAAYSAARARDLRTVRNVLVHHGNGRAVRIQDPLTRMYFKIDVSSPSPHRTSISQSETFLAQRQEPCTKHSDGDTVPESPARRWTAGGQRRQSPPARWASPQAFLVANWSAKLGGSKHASSTHARALSNGYQWMVRMGCCVRPQHRQRQGHTSCCWYPSLRRTHTLGVTKGHDPN